MAKGDSGAQAEKKTQNMRLFVCANCGKEFSSSRYDSHAKFCSRQCAGIQRRVKIKVQCSTCGTDFEIRPSDIARNRHPYCSRVCSKIGLSKSLSKALKGNPKMIANGKRNCISLLAYYAAGNRPSNYSREGKQLKCANCGGDFDVHPHKLKDGKGKYCSLECYNKARRNPDASENQRQRFTLDYKTWKRVVLERDCFTCQDCGLTGQQGAFLIAHHIKPFATNATRRTDINNGVTLCVACHYKLHFGCEKSYGVCQDCGGKCGQKSTRCRACDNILRQKRTAAMVQYSGMIQTLYDRGLSSRQIGIRLDRDHKSILHALRRMEIPRRSRREAAIRRLSLVS